MGQITEPKKAFQRLHAFLKQPKSIKWDFIKYALICTAFVLVGSWAIVQICFTTAMHYSAAHQLYIYEEIFDEDGNMEQTIYPDNEQYYPIYHLLNILSLFLIPPWCILCVVVCGTIFYRRKLDKPLKILLDASENIARNELDFSVEIPEQNELGQLCQSFEKMRASLQESYYEMWRQVEDRKRLNAAFSHDLRTPLTVLKGQNQMLIKYANQMSKEKVAETAQMMRRHITRLEHYVDTMNDVQALENIALQKRPVNAPELVGPMRETGALVCVDKEFVLISEIAELSPSEEWLLDAEAFMQVYENLLTNAVRFARERVTVALTLRKDVLSLTVRDDGAGFSEKELLHATEPFYKSAKEKGTNHFGMGLHICQILCEKHGGRLSLSNADGGGAQITATFRVCP